MESFAFTALPSRVLSVSGAPLFVAIPAWTAVRESVWAYPALEIAHFLGVAILLGNLLLVELRVLGLGRAVDAAALARFALPVALAGFGLAAASGLVMFASQPGELLSNLAFQSKMAMLMIAGANAAVFHARGSLARGDGIARAQACASAALWIGVLAAGRLIAYV